MAISAATASNTPPHVVARSHGFRGFTLIELLVAITVIVVLIGLLFPAMKAVRNSANKASARTMINGLFGAIDIYAMEDIRHRYPPVEADGSLRTHLGTSGPAKTLDFLRDRGCEWRFEQLDSSPGSSTPDRLCDAWVRYFRYAVDDTMDKVATKPAPLQTDWNTKNREPYAYLWSIGQPIKNDTVDADPANAANWIYRNSAK